jgi:hypothetical protein
MTIQLPLGSWPEPLKHCGQPLVSESDEFITIGEITSELINGFRGTRMLYGALVPTDKLDRVLKNLGGIGHGVFSRSHHSYAAPVNQHAPDFWVAGPDSEQFEPLVHTWQNHNKIVLMPNNAVLEHFKLIPRITNDGQILWDDLDGPVYDVVRVTPLSHYTIENGCTPSRVSIRRDYLEDYLNHKTCSAVATYYDERFSMDDPQIAALLGHQGTHFQQPGREMWFIKMDLDYANQVSQVWACDLILTPTGSPISNPPEAELVWPDRQSPIKGEGMNAHFEVMERAYVRDEVLLDYEERDEFEISPEHGFVSYDSRWSVSYCDRFARNHIELELRKLYEGAPFHVIKHYNKFAVKTAVAENDRKQYGERHVGTRAKELIYSFLKIISNISELSDSVGLPSSQEEVGQFKTSDVDYSGWWTFAEFKMLGRTIPLKLSYASFLNRCKEIVKLLENLRPAPLRNILIKLGVQKDSIKGFASVKLLATLCQLAKRAGDQGLDLISDSTQLVSAWDINLKLKALDPLFALIVLRTADAHKTSSSTPTDVSKALQVFGIDEAQCQSGWGLALDKIYDELTSALTSIDKLIAAAWS